MRRIRPVVLVLLLAVGSTARFAAAQDTQPGGLTECLLRSTTSADKLVLVRWMFATMSLHPAVESMAPVPAEVRTKANQDMAALLARLLTDACPAEALAAFQAEDSAAIETSFGVLGEVAVTELFDDPAVAAGALAFTHYLDEEALVDALAPVEAD